MIESNGTNEKKIGKAASLDDALLHTGFGIYNIGNMLFSGLILMGMIIQTLGLSYVIPAAQCDLELTQQQKGWLAAVPFIAIILTSHMWGWLADTRGRRPIMLGSMLVSILFSVLSSFSPNLAVFTILQFIACIFIAGTSGVVYAYLGEFNNSQHRDKMVAFGAAFVGIGTVALPAISWLTLSADFAFPIPFLSIDYRPWRLMICVSTLPYVFASILMAWAAESPKFLCSVGRHDECLQVLRNMYSVNKRASSSDYPVKFLITDPQSFTSSTSGLSGMLTSMKDQTVPLFKPPLLMWTCLSCFVQFGIFATANGFYVWFPTILNSMANHEGGETKMCDILVSVSQSSANGTTTVCDDTVNTETFFRAIIVGLVFCSTYIIVGIIVDFVGKRAILVVVLAAAGLSGICAALVSHQMLAVALFGVFQMSGACIGLLTAVVVELYPTKLRAMAVCLSLMLGRVGSVLGSNLIGVLLGKSCETSFYLFGGLLLVCSLLCFTLPGKKQHTKVVKPMHVEPTQNETHEPV